jgi:heme-degrading monooxygenase HmoA
MRSVSKKCWPQTAPLIHSVPPPSLSFKQVDPTENEGGQAMISRHWRGLAKASHADLYVRHLHTETFPALRSISGFVEASILRRSVARGVEFLVVTQWESLEAIRAFAGTDVETAVVPEKVDEMMIDYDRTVRHYEVVS